MTAIHQNPPADAARGPTRTPKRAALASFMGSAVEYYDFFLFGSGRGTDLPQGVLPRGWRQAALLMSFATFGVAYFARPVGAFVLGHFGDRIGRQKVLMFTIVLMGVSRRSRSAACRRTAWPAGLAPILLVVCRLLQGFSAAGEQAGASSLTLEHAPDHQRAFFTSWTLTGTQGGLILASLVLIPFVSLSDEAELYTGVGACRSG